MLHDCVAQGVGRHLLRPAFATVTVRTEPELASVDLSLLPKADMESVNVLVGPVFGRARMSESGYTVPILLEVCLLRATTPQQRQGKRL